MTRGTTPTFICTFPDSVDFTEAENVYFTITQDGTSVTKTGDDLEIEAHTVSVFLTQLETLKFMAGTVKMQLNWTYSGGLRAASEIVTRANKDNLLPEVLK